MKVARYLLWVYALVFLAFPVLPLFLKIFRFSQEVFDRSFLLALRNSFLLSSGAAFFSAVLGLALALIVGRTRMPGRGIVSLLLGLPLFFPPYQFALGWSGLLPSGFMAALFSLPGAVFVLTGCFYPVVFWMVLISLYYISPEEEEAAMLFAPPTKVLKSITLPRTLPSLIAGALLVFLLSFAEPGVPAYFGVNVLPLQVLTQFSAFYNLRAALMASFPMVILGVAVFWAQAGFWREKMGWRERSSLYPGLVFKGGLGGELFLVVVFTVFFLLPSFSLLKEGISALPSALRWGARSMGFSLLYSSLAAMLVVGWAMASVFLLGKRQLEIFSYLSLFAFLIPPTALAVGVIDLWRRIPLPVYGTALMLIFALVGRYSFIGLKIMENSAKRLDPSPVEAAYLCGASPSRAFFRITLPSIRKWVFISFALVFVFSVNELGLSTMLYPPGGEPLIVRLYTLSVNSPLKVSSALSLLNSFLIIIVLLVFLTGDKK